MTRAAFTSAKTLPAPSPTLLAVDLDRLVRAANDLAAIGSANRANARCVADAWKNATALHFAELARGAGVRVRQTTFPEFCAELERRAVMS